MSSEMRHLKAEGVECTAAHPPSKILTLPGLTNACSIPFNVPPGSSAGLTPNITTSSHLVTSSSSQIAFPSAVLINPASDSQVVTLAEDDFLNRLKMSDGMDMFAERGR